MRTLSGAGPSPLSAARSKPQEGGHEATKAGGKGKGTDSRRGSSHAEERKVRGEEEQKAEACPEVKGWEEEQK